MSNIRAAIFASGTGSNFEAIMKANNLGCEIKLLICDQPGALVVEKAKQYNVPTFVFKASNYPMKQAYEREILQQLRAKDIQWIFLAGYMRIIGETLLTAYRGKIINIHPSLLPAFPGKDAIRQAVEAGAQKTGVTIHYVDEGIDTGPIISQETLTILPDDTVNSLKERIQQIEHRLYPKVIKELIAKKRE